MGVGSKDRILQVSKELFLRRGYMATSVDDIIADAKVAKSNFYYHYKSKEDLGIEVLEQRCVEFDQRRAATLSNDSLDPLERLAGFLQMLAAVRAAQASSGCPFGNLVVEMADHNERFRCYLSSVFTSLTDAVAEVISDGQTRGQFRDDVASESVAALVVHMIQGAHLLEKCHKNRDDYVHSVEVLLKLISAA